MENYNNYFDQSGENININYSLERLIESLDHQTERLRLIVERESRREQFVDNQIYKSIKSKYRYKRKK